MKTSLTRVALLAGTTLLAGGFALQAAAQDDFIELDPITFDLEGAEPVNDRLNPTILSGMKTATTITEVPRAASVIPRETFEKKSPSKVDEALRNIAGVQTQLYGYDSDTDWFYVRGFNAFDTGAFMDWLSLFSYGFGSFYIDPFLLERSEVLKGLSSMLYGASSPGGIVNYVSKLPDGTTGTRLSFGNRQRGPHLGKRRAVRRDR